MNLTLSRKQTKWFINYARFGYAAKGVVYCLTGIIAFMAAVGSESTSSTGRTNILNKILSQPFGSVLLGIVALGMLGYVLWRIIEAVKDPHDHGNNIKGILTRAGYAISAFVYLSISFYAFRAIFFGIVKSGSGSSQRDLISKVLDLPFGQWIVGVIAAIIFFRGLQQIYKGLSGKYKKNLKENQINPDYRNLVVRAGAVGSVARGLVWCLIAYMFLKAAMNGNENEVSGTDGALGVVATDFGAGPLAAMAVGLICYGIFKILQALYLRLIM
ncbi:MAG: DUF1206 domain-containing protein [Bacteroidota bacterium]|nr:DUF1206 domain-containing protein [Bacteroidota bacterium]